MGPVHAQSYFEAVQQGCTSHLRREPIPILHDSGGKGGTPHPRDHYSLWRLSDFKQVLEWLLWPERRMSWGLCWPLHGIVDMRTSYLLSQLSVKLFISSSLAFNHFDHKSNSVPYKLVWPGMFANIPGRCLKQLLSTPAGIDTVSNS